jgi:D-cysteine desulfhydrase
MLIYAIQIHAVGVCDTPDEFYDIVHSLSVQLGLTATISESTTDCNNVKNWLTIHDGQGRGYALSTEEELRFIHALSNKSGIILDPVYSGKALFHFYSLIKNQLLSGECSVVRPGDKVLFIHTGGVFGLYSSSSDLLPIIQSHDTIEAFHP